MSLPLSVLDLAPVPEGIGAAAALRRVGDLAQLADRLGYVRLWYAEHHGMASVASSSPEILIGHSAGLTQRLRLGAGGVMLPNHAALKVAENFRTLAALYPERIDLGLGRAPGSEPIASQALRAIDGERFPAQLAELLAFCGLASFNAGHPFARVAAVPADVPLPPIWILGSSGASAQLAGSAGLGYSFASHFSAAPAAPAFEAYRRSFRPSAAFPKPHAILGLAAVCAETAEQAEYLATTMDLAWLRIRRGEFRPLPSPEEALAYPYNTMERGAVAEYRERTLVGTPQQVRAAIERRATACLADEVMITSNLYDHASRLRSYELLAQVFAA